jgi:hypothetical protein
MIRLAIAAAGIGLSTITPASAHADAAEQDFIKVLDANNIHYGTRAHGLAMGHAVCRTIDAGQYNAGTVVGALRYDNRLSYDDAAAIAAAAIGVFCPWDKS